MGAEASRAEGSGAAGDGGAKSGGEAAARGGATLRSECQRLQERVRELEAIANAGGGPVDHSRLAVLRREPTIGLVQLTPQTCGLVDQLFGLLDVNGDGVLSEADIPSLQGEVDVRGRAAALLKPLSDFLVCGEMTPAELRRALATRAAKQSVAAPDGTVDTLAGWIAATQREANHWVQQTVREVIDGRGASGGTNQPPPRTVIDLRPRCSCAALTGLVMGFGNLGFPTSHEKIFNDIELPLWTAQYTRMSLGETFHVARMYAERC